MIDTPERLWLQQDYDPEFGTTWCPHQVNDDDVGYVRADIYDALHVRVLAAEDDRDAALDGSRPLPFDRETLGRMVREAWVRWALTQPNPKPSWLLPYDELSEPDKEADRQIGEAVARWTLIGDAARIAAITNADAPASPVQT